jgi:hypothetical protein
MPCRDAYHTQHLTKGDAILSTTKLQDKHLLVTLDCNRQMPLAVFSTPHKVGNRGFSRGTGHSALSGSRPVLSNTLAPKTGTVELLHAVQ